MKRSISYKQPKICSSFYTTNFIALFFVLVVFFSIFPDQIYAADSSRISTPAAGGATFWVWVICFVRRKHPIGGWLLYYFIALYAGFIMSILFTITSLPNYSPLSWDTMADYLLFMFTTVPKNIFILIQIFLSFYLLSKNHRTWKHIEALKKVLLLDFAFSIFNILIEANLWPESVFFSAASGTLSLLWFFYFKNSVRVQYVFKDRRWNWEVFHPIEIAPIR